MAGNVLILPHPVGCLNQHIVPSADNCCKREFSLPHGLFRKPDAALHHRLISQIRCGSAHGWTLAEAADRTLWPLPGRGDSSLAERKPRLDRGCMRALVLKVMPPGSVRLVRPRPWAR